MVILGGCFLFFNTFRDEPIVVMTCEEAAEVARLGSDIKSLAPPKSKTEARRKFQERLPSGPPEQANPNYFVTTELFGFVFYYNYSN